MSSPAGTRAEPVSARSGVVVPATPHRYRGEHRHPVVRGVLRLHRRGAVELPRPDAVATVPDLPTPGAGRLLRHVAECGEGAGAGPVRQGRRIPATRPDPPTRRHPP